MILAIYSSAIATLESCTLYMYMYMYWYAHTQSCTCPCEVMYIQQISTFMCMYVQYMYYTMYFVCRTIIQGYKKALTWSDIWRIRRDDGCRSIVPRFEREWHKELSKAGML